MKKHTKILTITLALMLIFTLTQINSQAQAANNDVLIIIDGKNIAFDQPPIIENGRTLVPMRAIFESLGADVTWIKETQSIIGKKNNTTVNLQLGNPNASLNGEKIKLDVAAKSINGRTLVPTRFISKSLGCEIKWDEKARLVRINSEDGIIVDEGKDKDSKKDNVRWSLEEAAELYEKALADDIYWENYRRDLWSLLEEDNYENITTLHFSNISGAGGSYAMFVKEAEHTDIIYFSGNSSYPNEPTMRYVVRNSDYKVVETEEMWR